MIQNQNPHSETGSIATRISDLMENVRYFHATTDEEKEKIYRLRHDAYVAEGAIDENADGRFEDEHDHDPNAFILGIELGSELIASIRLHLTTPDYRSGPALEVFRDELEPLLDNDESFVDPTRFVIHGDIRKYTTLLPFAGLRLGSMLADHFNATYMLATVRPEHVPFYDRVCRLHPRTPARNYPGLKKPIALCYNDMDTLRMQLHPKFPVFKSTQSERIELYGPSTSLVGHQSWRGIANNNVERRFSWSGRSAEIRADV